MFIEFDFIPNAAVFRKDCLEEYSWDPNYTIGGEHLDFYVGHWKETDWRFGICPNVSFQHFPGGSPEYLTERTNTNKLRASYQYFGEKWGYSFLERGQQFCSLEVPEKRVARLGLLDENDQLADDVTVEFFRDETAKQLELHVVPPGGNNIISGKKDLLSDGLNREVMPLMRS